MWPAGIGVGCEVSCWEKWCLSWWSSSAIAWSPPPRSSPPGESRSKHNTRYFYFPIAKTSPRAWRLPSKGAKLNTSLPLWQSIPVLSFFQPKSMGSAAGHPCHRWVRLAQGTLIVHRGGSALEHSWDGGNCLAKGWRGSPAKYEE